jgi:hypothetical protein
MEEYEVNEEMLELFIQQVCLNRLDKHQEEFSKIIDIGASKYMLGATDEEIREFMHKEIKRIMEGNYEA